MVLQASFLEAKIRRFDDNRHKHSGTECCREDAQVRDYNVGADSSIDRTVNIFNGVAVNKMEMKDVNFDKARDKEQRWQGSQR